MDERSVLSSGYSSAIVQKHVEPSSPLFELRARAGKTRRFAWGRTKGGGGTIENRVATTMLFLPPFQPRHLHLSNSAESRKMRTCERQTDLSRAKMVQGSQ